MEEDREEDEEKNWLNGKREPALSDLQKEVIAYRKKREEEDPTPQEFHICDVLGIRFRYSLWRDFKCPAVNGCGFEYKVKLEGDDGKEITDDDDGKKKRSHSML